MALPVRIPYRLDLTVEALRRVRDNVVDVMTSDGRYMRAFSDANGINVVEVRQNRADCIAVCIAGDGAQRHLPAIATMLGTQVDLSAWYRHTKCFPWLARLANCFRGVKPPRYPDLWEALSHGIVFQQLSIVAAASVMRRFVERFSSSVKHDSIILYPFPRPETVAGASASALRSVGLSRMKASYLKSSAEAVLAGHLDAVRIGRLSTDEAVTLLRTVRGIGRWTAAVVLLRGFGRLDVFPPTDSGASQSIKMLSSNPRIDESAVLESLDGVRGMLYFHLLLGRLHGMSSLTTA